MSILDALKKLITKRGGTAKGSNIAEVISNYANEDSPSPSGGGGLIVDTEFINEGGYEVYYKTNVLASEIEAAYKAGKCVNIHFPPVPEGFYGDAQTLTITGWVDADLIDIDPFGIMFGSYTTVGKQIDHPINFGKLEISSDGYIKFYYYRD